MTSYSNGTSTCMSWSSAVAGTVIAKTAVAVSRSLSASC